LKRRTASLNSEFTGSYIKKCFKIMFCLKSIDKAVNMFSSLLYLYRHLLGVSNFFLFKFYLLNFISNYRYINWKFSYANALHQQFCKQRQSHPKCNANSPNLSLCLHLYIYIFYYYKDLSLRPNAQLAVPAHRRSFYRPNKMYFHYENVHVIQ